MSSASRVTASGRGRAVRNGPRPGPGAAPRQGAAPGPGQTPEEGISIGVILGFPAEIATELRRWRASFGDPMAATVPAHITLVTTTMTQDWDATLDHVREVARSQQPFTVTIAGTGSFRPVSPVVFLNVEDGFGECVSLHRRLQAGPLERELPFAYHPHVTVAHDVAPESLDEAEAALKDYRVSFPVASMGLYEHDDNGIWQLREELDFGTEPDNRRGPAAR
ncbi:2'-5' RNA ligase family protein [Arthrobacter sp. Hor0625]|uniref:2'-5' RNA ligase family protein n=1 Tax=Arthrobacter sp. Hor0625 TaxID=3457358 RepID=UPI00403E66E1